MTTIKIHRGTHQIGGTITEISDGANTIFIDFGNELAVEPEKSTDADMVNMMHAAAGCRGVLFTHYHGDHVGLLAEIPDGIPIYIGRTARQILLNIRKQLLHMNNVRDREKLQREYDILRDDSRICELADGETQIIEGTDIKVTPMAADHSAFDAFMFLLEMPDGKTVLHTGDFRAHGWLGREKTDQIYTRLRQKTVDVLLIEGTMLSRMSEPGKTEAQLKKEASEVLSRPENKYAFLICSSTNVDSLASFCAAANELGRPLLVNSYVLSQIRLYRQAAEENKVYQFRKCHEITYKLETILSNGKTQEEVLRYKGFLMLVRPTEYYQGLADRFVEGGKKPLVFYSMWEGYLNREDELNYNKELDDFLHRYRKYALHSGGHAQPDDIAELINTVRPREAVLPIHTEKPKNLHLLNIDAELLARIRPLADGDTWPAPDTAQ